MPTYKLTYFNFKGRAELIRYIFAYKNTEYEDVRIEFSEWPALKPSIPYGQLPILEIDGVVYHQSIAIARYLAKQAGLVGKTDLDNLRIDAIIDSLDDFISAFPWSEPDEEKKKQKQEEYIKNGSPTLLAALEKSLGDKTWFAGDYVTWADFYWDTFSDGLEAFDPNFAKNLPNLQALKKRVQSISQIASWLERRPKTEH
ncbi:hematopoietic prostaglandin D synthase [Pelobates cultripes]|uniref:glutathione transferase n=1 Tax=Pelobates cultripes TaxID=61616 RepID=A0AAD1SIP2_PELCU|nr:hematopoietic prostaglandin D synthase [Pelobates cultripes]